MVHGLASFSSHRKTTARKYNTCEYIIVVLDIAKIRFNLRSYLLMVCSYESASRDALYMHINQRRTDSIEKNNQDPYIKHRCQPRQPRSRPFLHLSVRLPWPGLCPSQIPAHPGCS